MMLTQTGILVRWRYWPEKRKALYTYAENKVIELGGQTYVIPADYWFDGATVPRPLWGVFSPNGIAFHAAALHDWLYDTQGKGMSGFSQHSLCRKKVDLLFYRMMRMEGTPRAQARLMYWAVRTPVGKKYWDSDSYPYYLAKDGTIH